MKILVIDVGGSNVKCVATGHKRPSKFKSGSKLTRPGWCWGNRKWRGRVKDVVEGFRKALLPDYIVLGGGNVKKLKRLPPRTRRGDNAHAFFWRLSPVGRARSEIPRVRSESAAPSLTRVVGTAA